MSGSRPRTPVTAESRTDRTNRNLYIHLSLLHGAWSMGVESLCKIGRAHV